MSRHPSGNTSDSFMTTQGSWNSGSNSGGANKRGSDSSGASWEGGNGGRATSWDSLKTSPTDTPKLEARKPSFTSKLLYIVRQHRLMGGIQSCFFVFALYMDHGLFLDRLGEG